MGSSAAQPSLATIFMLHCSKSAGDNLQAELKLSVAWADQAPQVRPPGVNFHVESR
jgi:hypothetical protein